MNTVLQAKKRETGKRSTLTQLRKQGKLAAVVYGYNTEAIPIVLDYKETAKAVQRYGYTSVFTIDVEGNQLNAVLSEIQRDALKGGVKHMDFLVINMKKELDVEVPIVLIGEPIGVKEGGILMQPTSTLKIKVNPSEMPDSIEIDISNLKVGDNLSLVDIRQNIQYDILNEDEELTIAVVTPPKLTAETAEEEAPNEEPEA